MAHVGANKLGRQELLALPSPPSTDTHQVVPHARLIQTLIESLALRNINVERDEYAVTPDGARMFGFLEINNGERGIRFALGVRNSHDKSFALGLTVGYRVFVCDNLSFHGDFMAVSKRHSKNMVIEEVIAVGVERAQRQFEPMTRQINVWKNHELPDVRAKSIIYDAIIGGGIDAPKHIAKSVHQHYFAPVHEEFHPRNLWSLSNAFTSAFNDTLEPIPQMKAAASLAPFIAQYEALT